MNFSVLMTVYLKDSPVYFERALTSITFDQVRKPDEIVLVCDGPLSEELNKVIGTFEKVIPYLKVCRLHKNCGQGNALNYGLKNCSFELIARMDSDDISLPHRFKEQVDYMERNKNTDVLSSVIEEFSSSFSNYRKLPESHSDISNLMSFRSPVNHGCCIYKKSTVIAAGGYSQLFQCQDYLLWINMLSNGAEFHNLTECHMRVRMEEGYSRKIGYSYAKEEFAIQKYLFKLGMIGCFGFARNLFIKVGGRLLPEKIVDYVYRKYYR
ncbi:glycosyltransferase [Shewanella salipaludis]|uniref:Glycosyltransferase n=1 Tax=Shewanella salipaludis TaxID=2723052 RepID=A0A972JMY0_9GAMM|nr:glycosyltransferase [Shewanella salipaludis]NMH65601.1 glycosyltransferase [Shewanella salipaludis]